MTIYWNYLQKHKNEIFWIGFGQLLAVLGGFAGIKLLTNIMGPAGYGELALGLTVSGFISMFIYSPTGQVLLRYFSIYRQKKQLGLYFYVSKKLYLYTSVSLFLFAIIFCFIGSALFSSKWVLLVFSGILFGIISGFNSSFNFIQNAVRQRKIVALHKGGEVILKICLAVLFIHFFFNKGYCAIWGYFLATGLILFSQIKFILKNNDIKKNWNSKERSQLETSKVYYEFYSYGMPFIIWSVFGIITAYSDRWIIQGYMNESSVGIYVALYQIASVPMVMILGVLTQFVMPVLFERAGDLSKKEKKETADNLFKGVVWISASIIVFMVLTISVFSKEVVALLTTNAFAAYYTILPILLVGTACFNMGQILSIKGMYLNKTKIYILPKAIYAIILIILALILTDKYGLFGMSLAISVSSFIYMLSTMLSNRKLKYV